MKVPRRIAKNALIRQLSHYKRGTKIIAFALFFVMLFSTIILYFVELSVDSKINIIDIFWTTLFTITGAGDFAKTHPTSPTGKLIILILSICSIGIVGVIIAELAGNFVLKKLKEALGMGDSSLNNHYIVCGWNSHASVVINELSKCRKPLVLIADIENPLTDYEGEKCFIHGDYCVVIRVFYRKLALRELMLQ
jgi:hypothetical protein